MIGYNPRSKEEVVRVEELLQVLLLIADRLEEAGRIYAARELRQTVLAEMTVTLSMPL